MRGARWLAAAIAALSVAGCTAGSPARPFAQSRGWRTYTQPPGPMRLTFRYPAGWQASGATLVSTMGNVGEAQVTGHTAVASAEIEAAGSCPRRVRLLEGSGVDITWSANIGSPSPIRLSTMGGRKVRIDGHPARLVQEGSSVCGPETVISGVIEIGPRTFLFMHADIGPSASPATLAAVRTIFFSARP